MEFLWPDKEAAAHPRIPALRPGFVYLVTNPAWPGYLKVGAAKSLRGRLSDFQTASPHRDFRISAAAPVNDRFAAEGRLKELLRGFRVKGGEWFRIHSDDARAMLVKLQEENV